MKKEIEYDGKTILVTITDENVKIHDSYKITDKENMFIILQIIINFSEYKLTRKIEDLLNEWKVHNLAYKLHFMRSHTRDTDLNENEDKLRLFIYKVLGLFL